MRGGGCWCPVSARLLDRFVRGAAYLELGRGAWTSFFSLDDDDARFCDMIATRVAPSKRNVAVLSGGGVFVLGGLRVDIPVAIECEFVSRTESTDDFERARMHRGNMNVDIRKPWE